MSTSHLLTHLVVFQLSYADTNPILSDRETYPHFFRTVPSDSDFNPARIMMLRHFNWTRVGTLFQDASKGSRYAYVSIQLMYPTPSYLHKVPCEGDQYSKASVGWLPSAAYQ